MGQKEIVLVLHHTYLHDAFRDYPNFNMDRFDELKSCRFVARFIIEKQTDNTSIEVAITSDKVYKAFIEKFKTTEKTAGAYRFLQILDKLIIKVDTPDIIKLDEEEGVIAIADKIFSTSSDYEPIIVITKSARDNFLNKAEEFYRATLKEKFTVIPFRILTVEEAQPFLEDKYAAICQMIKERIGNEF
jgi:hypothetical protein